MRSKIRTTMKKMGIAVSMAAFLFMATPDMSYAATAAYVAVDGANIRQKPVDGDNITSLDYGSYVEVTETQQGSDGMSWSKILFTNQGQQIYGWVRSDLITAGTDAPATDNSTPAETTPSDTNTSDSDEKKNDDSKSDDTDTSKNDDSKSDDSKEDESDSKSDDTDEEKSEESDSKSESSDITIGSLTFTISEKFSSDDIPSDFSKGKVTYKEQEYKGAVYDNGELSLLYLINNSDESGAFYVCDGEKIYPFMRVNYGKDKLIFLENSDTSELPTGSTETIIALEDGTQLSAYWYLGKQDASDFYEVYAMNGQGECGWYSYDSVDKNCQRLNIQDNSGELAQLNKKNSELKEKAASQKSGFHKIIAGLIILCVLLLFGLINLMMKGKNEDSENESTYNKMVKKAAKVKKAAMDREKEAGEELAKPVKPKKESDDVFEETDDDVLMKHDITRNIVEKPDEEDLDIMDLNDL